MELQARFNKAEFLKSLPLFSTLVWQELTEILMLCEDLSASAGDRLFSQGDEPAGLYIIERGEVEITMRSGDRRDLVLAHLGNGSVIGEMALIDGSPRSASVEVVAPTTGYFLSRTQFEALWASGSAAANKIALQLARILEERRRQLEQQIEQIRLQPESRLRLLEPGTRELIGRFRTA